jgi:hypothetical protein
MITSCITSNPTLCISVPFTVQLALPCEVTVVTASTISDITLAVWDASISTSSNLFADTDPATGLTNQCPLSYSVNVNGGPLPSFFTYNPATLSFTVYSNSMNDVGVYNVNIAGSVTAFPARYATTGFQIHITDPCLTTTINVPAAVLSSMTTSVLV